MLTRSPPLRVTAAGYTRFHDQLLLSASTDGAVKLWRAASISSAPPAEYELDGALGTTATATPTASSRSTPLGRVSDFWGASRARSRTPLTPLLLRPSLHYYRYDEHEQSVFGLVWSAADAWVFASLSLDGKCMISHVPPAEKYKILL